MRLLDLHVDGFGKLVERDFDFDADFNVVLGANEAGKSTLSWAILASLYGIPRGDKDRWRPWQGQRYGARLRYRLADGRIFEVQREFDRDSKGIRVYDESGNDASAQVAVGKAVSPGEAHLGLPLEVFTNASFAAQGDVTIDGFRAERISHSLAHALDGGPREDAALGALNRLDAAISEHVGRKRATVNAPLKKLNEEIAELVKDGDAMRDRLRALGDLRSRLDAERARGQDLDATVRRQESHGRSLRAYAIRSRLDALREIRDDLSALSAERAQYDDVDTFPDHVVSQLEQHYREWYAGEALARESAEEAERNRMTPALAAELEEREADGGALDDDRFAALESAGREATEARDRATAASDLAQNARRNIEGGGEVFGALVTAGGAVAVAAGVLAFFNELPYGIALGILAVLIFAFAWTRWDRRHRASRTADEMQRSADTAMTAERDAAGRVAAVLGPLGVPSIDELRRRRDRVVELRTRKDGAARATERAAAARRDADASAAAFDALAARVVDPSGSRVRDLESAKERESRKRTRDGIDVRLSMLDVRRGDVLGSDDEFALEAELAELTSAGVEPHAPSQGSSIRAFEAERSDLQRRAADSERNVAALEAELAANETHAGDLAGLDEETETLRARARKLEAFEAAVELARKTIDTRTKEAHQKFARRLSDYASHTFAAVTATRYADIRVDPTTLAVRVRTPENGAIVDVDLLSAGTREQAHLVTRLAMARMFSEGLEPAPLLLDDPFAFWDEARVERSLPILESVATGGTQLTIFTTSDALAKAAAARGARVIDLARRPTASS